MKNVKMKLAVLGTLSVLSAQAFAAGSLCALAAAPASSAYINAYNSGRVIPPLAGPATTAALARGNFGSLVTSGTVTTCNITGLATEITPPLTGYTLVTSAVRAIPPTTGGAGSIGSLLDLVFRKPAATAPATPTDMCIFGTRVGPLTNTDHDAVAAGVQLFEANDIARGGFSASGAVNVGYFIQSATASPVYRAGRTFTSVQHRAYIYGGGTVAQKQNNATGYLDLPAIAGLATTAINGNAGTVAANAVAPAATAGTQQAQINSNWVDFTHDVTFGDPDGGTNNVAAVTYIEAPCNSDSKAVIDATWVKAGAISLRQTVQETQSGLKAIDISGYAPPGAVVP